jgi:iron complex outermembrane receptor protein
VFDQRQIKALGASTVTDLFRYITQQTHTMSESYLGDGTQFADLRGLGFDTTLVLINGHRTVATASSLTFNAFDLNSIPLGAVERVEIVSDSTSALHGADAIGGVVNIVLRDDIPDPTLDVDYGAAAGGSVERRATFASSAVRARAKGSIVLDYFDRSPLLGRERDRWNNQDFSRYGSTDWRAITASPGNVSSPTPDNLPGLPSTFAAIPTLEADVPLTAADFLATAGQRNLESLYRYQPVIEEGTRKGVVAQGEYSLATQLKARGELLYADRIARATFEPPALFSQLVPGTNPHNPFGADVLVDVLLSDLGPRAVTRQSDLFRGVGSLSGRVGEWDWEASLHKIQDDAEVRRTKDLDFERVSRALAATDVNQALDVFGGTNSPSLLASLLAPPERSRYHTEAVQSAANVRGPAVSLPTGHVEVMVGGEWRTEAARYELVDPVEIAGSHRRKITAGFGEARVPLVNQSAKVPGLLDLSLILSGRYDDYSDVGGSFNPEYALAWRPLTTLTLRAALAKSFRPPPLFDLYLPSIEIPVPTADPARNGEVAVPRYRAGGNPNLQPSRAESLTTTMKFAPVGLAGLQIEASYWRIHVEDRIGIPSAARLLAAEDRFGERIVRGEPSPADLAAGRPGPIEVIDISRMNFGSIRTSGIDFSISTAFETRAGRFAPTFSATWVHDFTTSDLVEGPDVRRVSVANLQGTVAHWRAVAGLSWSRQGFGASSVVRYLPSYDDVNALGARNGRTVQSQALLDAQFSLDLTDMVAEQSYWAGVEVRAGVLNLLDAEPPFAEVSALNGFDPSQGELRQRFVYVKLTKKF